MLEPDPSAQVETTTTAPSVRVRDKRLPYVSHRGASPHENLNDKVDFERVCENRAWDQRIVCRHLALLYCEELLTNPDFHPSQFFCEVDPRAQDPDRLFEVMNGLSHFSRARHLLPSHRFGEFLQQAFIALLQREGHPWAVYVVLSLTHVMALRLQVKTKDDGAQELVVQVYDPNQTRVQAVARVATPQDWNREQQAHSFLSFLCPSGGARPNQADMATAYFGALDPDAHLSLYEVELDTDGDWVRQEASCPLVTNWCTSSRIQLAHTTLDHDEALRIEAIDRFFNDPTVDVLHHPRQLLELPQMAYSVLLEILLVDHAKGRSQWQLCWELVQDPALKVQLLRGADSLGTHLLWYLAQANPEGMRWWLGLVATLPAQQMVQVLTIDDNQRHFPLEAWLTRQLSDATTPWPFMLDAIGVEHPEVVREILASKSADGIPMLAAHASDEDLPLLREWGTYLPKVSDSDRIELLRGQDCDGVSALYRAMLEQAPGWIGLWGDWCTPLEPGQRAQLLQGPGPQGDLCLFTQARQHHRATLQAWIDLWQQLPEEYRAETLAAAPDNAHYTSVLDRAMTGGGDGLDAPRPGCVSFIEHWGTCLEAVPPEQRAALLQGSPAPSASALHRGLVTGHWEAVLAWTRLLRWVTPVEREALTRLPKEADHLITQATRKNARKDPAAYHAALQALRETLPEKAWAWMQALAPAQ